MYSDVVCPYCGVGQEINHDDGYGYEDDCIHEQECHECRKTFAYTTSISFNYEVKKADCLNDGEHQFEATNTYPRQYTRMRCRACGETRLPTNMEWLDLMHPMEAI
jgi:hypothetical protein